MTAARTETHFGSSILAMQFGVTLGLLLALQFLSASLFYLYVFNLDIGPYFTATRFVHFYAGLASIPYMAAHLLSVSVRVGGYYLRVKRYHDAGPPPWPRRALAPLLVANFIVLYGSGLYMLFHYYYDVTNIPPFGLFPVQTHLWAAIVAVPLVSAHVGLHLFDVLRDLRWQRSAGPARESVHAPAAVLGRRALLLASVLGAAGLALGFQNTSLQRGAGPLFISKLPPGEEEGPGAFPTETLFGVETAVDVAAWRLAVTGDVGEPLELTYADLLALPAVDRDIRISCVSGWTATPAWRGPLVRDVLALAAVRDDARGIRFQSITNYGLTWARHRATTDDAILATHVNGAPLSAYHGFPVRLIVPGYPGQNMIKQLREIRVQAEADAFDPNFHVVQHRGPKPIGTGGLA